MTEQSGTTPTPGDPPSTAAGHEGLTGDEATGSPGPQETPGPPTGSDAPSDSTDDDPLEGRGHA